MNNLFCYWQPAALGVCIFLVPGNSISWHRLLLLAPPKGGGHTLALFHSLQHF